MSYELSGFRTPAEARAKMRRLHALADKARKGPAVKRARVIPGQAHPATTAVSQYGLVGRRRLVLPGSSSMLPLPGQVAPVFIVKGSTGQLGELGFSLKPPKKLRKAVAKVAKKVKKAVTLKNVGKFLAINAAVAGVVLTGGALAPALAPAAGAVLHAGGALVRGGAGLLTGGAKAVTGLFRKAPGATSSVSVPAEVMQAATEGITQAATNYATQAVQAAVSPEAPAAVTATAPTNGTAAAQPSEAGMGSALPLIGLAALAGFMLLNKPRRARG